VKSVIIGRAVALTGRINGGKMNCTKLISALVLCCLGAGYLAAQRLVVKRPRVHGTAPEKVVTCLDVDLSIPVMPKINEPFHVTMTITCDGDFEILRFGPDYTIIFESNGAKITVGKDQTFSGYMKVGETRAFQATMIVEEPITPLNIYGGISSGLWGSQGIGFSLYLIDERSGQYGTHQQWLQTNVLWKYDHREGQWLEEPDPAWELTNQRIAEEMKQFEPALADSEALCLHQDNMRLIINAIGDPAATDSERIRRLLDAGWLEALRSGNKEKWLEDFCKKSRNNSNNEKHGK
jgi:hypothetical protein